MALVDIFLRMEHTQHVSIVEKINKTEREVFAGENQDIPLQYLDYYVYNIRPLSSTTIQVSITR